MKSKSQEEKMEKNDKKITKIKVAVVKCKISEINSNEMKKAQN